MLLVPSSARVSGPRTVECEEHVAAIGILRRLGNRSRLQLHGHQGYRFANGSRIGDRNAADAAGADLARTAQRRADAVEGVGNSCRALLHDSRVQRRAAVREDRHSRGLLAHVESGKLRLQHRDAVLFVQRKIECP